MRVGTAIATGLIGVALLGACGADSKDDSSASTVAPTSTTEAGPEGPQVYVDSGNYVSGVHIAFVSSIDTTKRTATIDVAQFLTGDAATAAYNKETGETGPPDNDYWVVNANTQLRTFPVAQDVVIRVNNLGGFQPKELGQDTEVSFDTYVGYSTKPGSFFTKTLVWISLENGVITHIDEQFVP